MTPPLNLKEQDQAIDDAVASFPETFGLKAFPNEVFSIIRSACYYWDGGGVMLYTYILRDGDWKAFSKGTVEELRNEIKEMKT